jgi:hypothetical protein
MNEDRKLDELLDAWHCEPELNPSFGASVWQRIAEREEARWFRSGWFEVLESRPLVTTALAAALMAVAMAGGVAVAKIQVGNLQQYAAAPDLEQVYFHSIDPVAMANRGHPAR